MHLSLVHQLFLSFTSLQDWALYTSRVDLLTHNKEGIVSIPGYLAIHLLGLSTGLLILPPTPSHFRRSSTKKVKSNNASSSDDDEAYAKDAWVDETKAPEKKPLKRDDGKTAIELCSYGVLYAVLFIGSKLIASEDDVSRRLVSLTLSVECD
jgi:glucosaminylphosphatidylinositol acyltransferase